MTLDSKALQTLCQSPGNRSEQKTTSADKGGGHGAIFFIPGLGCHRGDNPQKINKRAKIMGKRQQ